MREVIYIAAGILAMAAAPVQAAEWWYISETSDEDLIFVDADSIITSGSDKSFWVQIEWRQVRKNVVSVMSNQTINCNKRTNSYRKILSYDSARSVVENFTYDYPKEEPIVPDTITDKLRLFVCSNTAEERVSMGIGPLMMSPHDLARSYRDAAAKK